MRLLNTKTFELSEFEPSRGIPDYAIVSHTWGPDELQFADFQDFDSARLKKPASAHKIDLVLHQAVQDGHKWIWMDNLCIDKANNTELAEAINSMFRYYKEAKTCYTFLADVSWSKNIHWEHGFSLSKWFTRGWTLQEMLASRDLRFLDHEGRVLGCMQDEVLRLTARVSGVPIDILTHRRPLSSASIAQRMSWAARRETSKAEDVAYCLLGIFDVNIPLLYGEGSERAFINRLQEEIAKTSNDQSIFAWQVPPGLPKPQHGLFAPSPKYFAGADNIVCGVPLLGRDEVDEKGFFEMGKRGMQMTLPLMSLPAGTTEANRPHFLGLLNCSYKDKDGRLRGPIALPLQERTAGVQGRGWRKAKDFWAVRTPSTNANARLLTVDPTMYIRRQSKLINVMREQPLARLVRSRSPRYRAPAALSAMLLQPLVGQSSAFAKRTPWHERSRSNGRCEADARPSKESSSVV